MYSGLGLFLDRDGILLAETGTYVWLVEQSLILVEARMLVELALRYKAKVIVITNQGGIGRRLYSYRQAQYLNHAIEARLFATIGLKPIWFICPHHPSTSMCWCRKPGALAFERALHRFGLQNRFTAMIGDQSRDMEAARSVGIHAYGLHPDRPVAGSDQSFTSYRECATALEQLWGNR